MQEKTAALLNDVAEYYSSKLAQHGETARGVDWNSEESQNLRFAQLCKIITGPEEFSLNDLGCGYGAFYAHAAERYPKFTYVGIDVSLDMIRTARMRHQGNSRTRFVHGAEPDALADYGIASGIFNVRLDRSDLEWREYLQATLDAMARTSRLGFAFNCLTSYSDEEKKRSYLYYADPCQLFDLCKRHYSKQVAILHDYGLYEFTVIVRKP